jgi:hypothetical protein
MNKKPLQVPVLEIDASQSCPVVGCFEFSGLFRKPLTAMYLSFPPSSPAR